MGYRVAKHGKNWKTFVSHAPVIWTYLILLYRQVFKEILRTEVGYGLV